MQSVENVSGCNCRYAHQDIRDGGLRAEKGAAPVRWDDLGDHALPGVGSETGSQSLPDQQSESKHQGQRIPQFSQKQRHQSQPQEGQTLLDGHQHHHRLVASQTRYRICHEQLRQLPSDRMDGRDEPDQQSGSGHVADEERDDGADRTEAPAYTKESAIQHVEDQVKAQVFADGRFQGGHAAILPPPYFLPFSSNFQRASALQTRLWINLQAGIK